MKPADYLKQERAKHPSLGKRQWYREIYLTSDHWKTLRKSALDAHGHRCERCNSNRRILDVHHLDYRHIFDVTIRDLQVLCRKCHEKMHKYNPKVWGGDANLKTFKALDLPEDVQEMMQKQLRGKPQKRMYINMAVNAVVKELRGQRLLTDDLHQKLLAAKFGKRARAAQQSILGKAIYHRKHLTS